MRTLLVIIRMATCTVRLISRESPIYEVCIGDVTIGALQVAAMVQRIIWQSSMHVDIGQPSCGIVTNVALAGRYEVAVVLACSKRAVMAGRTRTEYLCVINSCHGHPHCRCMTIFTDIRRRYVVLVLAGCIRAIVATDTIADDIRVIKIRRSPGNGRMAIVAVVTARDMRGVFADCNVAVVTRRTCANDLRVVNRNNRLEERRAVAIFTDVAGQNVILVLANCIRAVVAINAIGRVVCMIEGCRYPSIGRMAGIAIVAAGNMGCVLADSDCVVVTR